MADNGGSAGGVSQLSRRVEKSPTLVEEVTTRLLADIRTGNLQPGARLPTEREMMQQLGVSRTVIREAVAQLRASGVVTTRQGLGAFVSAGAHHRTLQISPNDMKVVGDLINLNELRLAIEVEAAARAAARASAESIERLRTALDDISAAIDRGEDGAEEDFRFHQAVAEASGNPHFPRTLDFLGQYSVPRRATNVGGVKDASYLSRLQNEHQQIFDAINDGNANAARDAMRQHLEASLARLGRLAQQAL
ncbi:MULTISPECIES: FadR/GntR family transcriptional regulator [unclassified Devosia]|uniref:FadR/GntR family transcriptional regulator n=1 Tax=Devosia sp. MC521 TaxID=2759954 RepID=UPI0015F900D6|nr:MULTISPECIES: FadR/GntR family transcriptional regulator [unclassified Devosia]MBJ6988042.1 FadR family transcriptional regulator [Devosia sp. MC521]QMW62113.1 FadR family transcriptional regulator [Devosia sp. MC521]